MGAARQASGRSSSPCRRLSVVLTKLLRLNFFQGLFPGLENNHFKIPWLFQISHDRANPAMQWYIPFWAMQRDDGSGIVSCILWDVTMTQGVFTPMSFALQHLLVLLFSFICPTSLPRYYLSHYKDNNELWWNMALLFPWKKERKKRHLLSGDGREVLWLCQW